MTNYERIKAAYKGNERIKAMSVEEMANYFNEIFDCSNCPNGMLSCESNGSVCTKYIKQWLNSEVEE